MIVTLTSSEGPAPTPLRDPSESRVAHPWSVSHLGSEPRMQDLSLQLCLSYK